MKKFDRLPPQQRKEEIQAAALQLFLQKGFAATTMENIVQAVSLSKGGVYRLYPSTTAILSDLIIAGMHLRNAYYEQRVQQQTAAGRALTLPFVVEMIADSMLLEPSLSDLYVEFLWEKQRSPQLEALYQQISAASVEETAALIRQYGAEDILLAAPGTLERLTNVMNAVILSLKVLHLQDAFVQHKQEFCDSMLNVLKM